MPVTVRLSRRDIDSVVVLVMGVVDMAVLVVERLVQMVVVVAFRQVQPDTDTHEAGGQNELKGERLPE